MCETCICGRNELMVVISKRALCSVFSLLERNHATDSFHCLLMCAQGSAIALLNGQPRLDDKTAICQREIEVTWLIYKYIINILLTIQYVC